MEEKRKGESERKNKVIGQLHTWRQDNYCSRASISLMHLPCTTQCMVAHFSFTVILTVRYGRHYVSPREGRSVAEVT